MQPPQLKIKLHPVRRGGGAQDGGLYPEFVFPDAGMRVQPGEHPVSYTHLAGIERSAASEEGKPLNTAVYFTRAFTVSSRMPASGWEPVLMK